MRGCGVLLVVLMLGACGSAQSSGAAAPVVSSSVPTAPDVMVIRDPRALGAIAAQLPEDLSLDGRVLLLVGGWLPDHAARVWVVDPTSAPASIPAGVVSGAGAEPPYERVVASVTEGVLSIAFEHDVNMDGWCCSGIEEPDREACDGMPPMAPRATGEPLFVYLFVVPTELVGSMQVARTTSNCMRP